MQRWGEGLARAWRMPIQSYGLEQLQPAAPYIFMANHQSYADIVALVATLPNHPRFIGKAELKRVPIVSQAMRAGGHIFVDRSGGKNAIQAMDEAASRIHSGCSVIIFPEGTRNDGQTLGRLHSGGFRLAKRARVPIVPLGLRGTHGVLGRGAWLVQGGKVELHVGAPIAVESIEQMPTRALMAQVAEQIAALSQLRLSANAIPQRVT